MVSRSEHANRSRRTRILSKTKLKPSKPVGDFTEAMFTSYLQPMEGIIPVKRWSLESDPGPILVV